MSGGQSDNQTGLGAISDRDPAQAFRDSIAIPLSRGLVALIEHDDAEQVLKFKWHAHSCGRGIFYAARHDCVGGGTILMHRQIIGAQEGEFVDHINGDKMDNRRANLRICTPEQNRFNVPARFGTSEFKGVSRHSKNPVWVAHITFRGKNRYLGSFQVESDAARAYDAAAAETFGEFAHLNFPVGASV